MLTNNIGGGDVQIKSIEIKNLRSIRHVLFTVDDFTALIGGNNAGKSTILKAIELFFDGSPKLSPDDFSKGNQDDPIEITLEFKKLTPIERSEFGTACIGETLNVTRILSLDSRETNHYHVRALVYPEFDEIRDETNGTQKRLKHNAVAARIEGLRRVSSVQEVDNALAEWEASHPENLEARKLRGFFGAPNVANGKLKKKTGLYLIPAVREASDEGGDSRRSPILSLLSEIAKQTFENKKEVISFIERTKEEFAQLVDPSTITELAGIGDRLTESIQRFYPDSRLEAQWESSDTISLSYPSPKLAIEHNGMITDLGRVGHGLQRAALFSIVQFLAESGQDEKAAAEFEEAASDIIILVEEPEIYQHPNKQMVIYDALKKITKGFNRINGIRIQVIYTTHSEKFINVSDFNAARIVRHSRDNDIVTNTVSEITIHQCSQAFANFATPPKEPMSDEAFVSKLHIFTREVCEGFFANKVVLVEGSTDRAILHAIYQSRKLDAHREGISIISVDGKSKMDKPLYIFKSLGIPTYVVFDNDQNKPQNKRKPETNVLIQKVLGLEEPVEWPEGCKELYCAFSGDLEHYLKEMMGDNYAAIFNDVSAEFGLNYDEVKKTPQALVLVFERAEKLGIKFPLFDEIIQSVGAI